MTRIVLGVILGIFLSHSVIKPIIKNPAAKFLYCQQWKEILPK